MFKPWIIQYLVNNGPVNYNISLVESEVAYATYDAQQMNAVCILDDTHFAILYHDNSDELYLDTYSIDTDWTNITRLYSSIIKANQEDVSPQVDLKKIWDYLVLCYSDANADWFVQTYSLNASYQYTLINSLEYDTSTWLSASIYVLDDTHFIIAYRWASWNNWYLKTFSIDSSWNNITNISTSSNYSYNWLAWWNHMDLVWNYFVVSRNQSNNLYVTTFQIDWSYWISLSNTISIVNIVYPNSHDIKAIDNSHYCIIHDWADTQQIKTYEVNQTTWWQTLIGTNTISYTDSENGDFELVKINNNHLVCIRAWEESEAIIQTIWIDWSYWITVIDSLYISASSSWLYSWRMKKLNDFIYVSLHNNSNEWNILKSISID